MEAHESCDSLSSGLGLSSSPFGYIGLPLHSDEGFVKPRVCVWEVRECCEHEGERDELCVTAECGSPGGTAKRFT